MANLPKGAVTTLLIQLGGFTLKGIPGFTEETFKAQVENGNLRLYESDLPSLSEKVKKEGLDENKFFDLLFKAGAVLEGTRPAFGGKRTVMATRINSRERAEQVVTSQAPGAVEKFMEIMTEMINLAKEANSLIAGKAQVSLAVKNVGENINRRKKAVEVEE